MTSGLLTEIDSPTQLKGLTVEELKELAGELRGEILRVAAANGGHLATNLGSVELSIALHYTLDSPRDRIVWDVGNQCYTHKILTGRRGRFATIRKTSGLSGFVNRYESPHDHLTTGHAGTALSAALGIATARDYLDQDYCVVAVVGDGGMSAGLSYEALNNLGRFHSQLLLVLNDNSFSISPSCGAFAQRLKRAQARVLDGNVFEQLGIEYLGPVDGHDLAVLVEVLRDAKHIGRPVVLHVVTQKGKGYAPAELDPERFHGVSPFDIATGRPLSSNAAPTYSEVFGREMLRIADEDHRVIAITAAMSAGTGLTAFAERFPDRFFDVGIAEQHAVTFAAGLAASGCRPVVAIYSAFLQRSYDQVIHDACLQNLPVTFVLDRAGVVGADGPTHHGVFDLAYLRAVPRMVVMAPKDEDEFAQMLRLAVAHGGPAAVRIPRGVVPPPVSQARQTLPVEIGRGELLRDGADVGLIAIGSMVQRAMEVAEELEKRGIGARVVNARFVKPLDASLIVETARQVKRLFTLEEHAKNGGFGSAVLELLAEQHVNTPVSVLGLPDNFIEHGSTKHLLDECGLSTERIVARIVQEIGAGHDHPRGSVPTIDTDRLRAAVDRVRQRPLPEPLDLWVGEYGKVGNRDVFLWKWCLEGVSLTSLPCVDSEVRDTNNVTKVLGVMVDVLLDDVADQSGPARYLEELLQVPFATRRPDFAGFSPKQQAYAETLRRVWEAIMVRVRDYPRYAEFQQLLRYDYRQLFNTMRYSHMLNRDPQLLNLAEHDLYLPHNMHMMVSGTMDLMCSSGFDRGELGQVREVLWHAQCMGRIGNLITTWERELADRDFTSGVFAFAVREGIVTAQQLIDADMEVLRKAVAAHDCETFFLERWKDHRSRIVSSARSVRSVDISAFVTGLEQLLQIHLGSRGLK
jgi:1-deoxy-D-xylulose-5-phosphate synthase